MTYKYEYKERDYAEEILKNGFTSNHVRHELKILVKYYKEQGHKPKERKDLIYDFCEKYLDGYDRVTHFKMINSVLNYGSNRKNKLIQIDNVNVTKKELEYIEQLGLEHDYKKILFTWIVLDKLNKKYHEIRNDSEPINEYYFGGRYNYNKLITYSNINLKRKSDIHKIIHKLSELGLVEIRMKSKIKLLFMYEISKNEEVAMEISNFEKIGMYYDLHCGINRIKECENCGEPIKVIGNKTKYCSLCAKRIKNEQNKKYYHLGK